MSELHHHFVKINTSDFEEAPFVFYGIISLEVFLNLCILICHPFVCLAFLRAEVMHRNFRMQLCLATVYYTVQIYCRFILLYYELNDILPRSFIIFFSGWKQFEIRFSDIFALFQVLLCSSASLLPSTSLGTNEDHLPLYWYLELTNIIPAFTNALLCYSERISNVTNFFTFGVMLTISLVVFIRTFLVNLRMLQTISQGATINYYSVAITFKVRENVEVMTYMCKLAIPASITSSIAFAGFGWKLYGPTEWRLSRNIAYAFFDLGLVIYAICFQISAIISNERIPNEKIYPIPALYQAAGLEYAESNQQVYGLPVPSETSSYFDQLNAAWNRRHHAV